MKHDRVHRQGQHPIGVVKVNSLPCCKKSLSSHCFFLLFRNPLEHRGSSCGLAVDPSKG
jgi:hypothetical protein